MTTSDTGGPPGPNPYENAKIHTATPPYPDHTSKQTKKRKKNPTFSTMPVVLHPQIYNKFCGLFVSGRICLKKPIIQLASSF